MAIIGSHTPVEIGKRYDAEIWDKDLELKRVSFFIVRKATFEEYKEWLKENDSEIQNKLTGNEYYYEINID